MIDFARIARRFRLHRRLVRGMVWSDDCTLDEIGELEAMAAEGVAVKSLTPGGGAVYDYPYRWDRDE